MRTLNVIPTMAFAAMFVLVAVAGARAEGLADPLDSPMWEEMRAQFLSDARYEFDERVKVEVPRVVENQAQVPVTVDARGLDDVQKVVVFADLNPIQHAHDDAARGGSLHLVSPQGRAGHPDPGGGFDG